MRKTRRTEISLEIEEAVAIRMKSVVIANCRGCRKQTRMVGANDAAMLARLSTREIYRFVEAERLHFTEDQCGLLFVCLESLRELVRKRDEALK